ncbi:hypothetical protein FQR65_LT16724 [Abscondita terminalis]|nr:hypothetical protein FQR65_LT16724 [Abscondita terminalis]
MQEFPCLRKTYADELISADFEVAFPGLENNLFERFPKIKTKLSSLVKEKKTRDNLLPSILNLETGKNLCVNLFLFLYKFILHTKQLIQLQNLRMHQTWGYC